MMLKKVILCVITAGAIAITFGASLEATVNTTQYDWDTDSGEEDSDDFVYPTELEDKQRSSRDNWKSVLPTRNEVQKNLQSSAPVVTPPSTTPESAVEKPPINVTTPTVSTPTSGEGSNGGTDLVSTIIIAGLLVSCSLAIIVVTCRKFLSLKSTKTPPRVPVPRVNRPQNEIETLPTTASPDDSSVEQDEGGFVYLPNGSFDGTMAFRNLAHESDDEWKSDD